MSPMVSWASGLVAIQPSDNASGLKMNKAPNRHAYTNIRPTNPIFRSHAFLRRFSTSRLSNSVANASSSASTAASGFHQLVKLHF
jgi:hypothetical protein